MFRGTVGIDPNCPAGTRSVCVHLVSLVGRRASVPSVFVCGPMTSAYRRVDSSLYPRTHDLVTQVAESGAAQWTTVGAATDAGTQAESETTP